AELTDEYRAIGFPLDEYRDGERLHWVQASAERIPLPDDFVDAVISVNAIDHFDDLDAVATELARVMRDGAVLRAEVHYHRPRPQEPQALDDQVMKSTFGRLGIRKIHEEPFPGESPGPEAELLTLWA